MRTTLLKKAGTVQGSLTIGAVVLLVACTVASAADSWPQWRGPNRDGISPEKGLLASWESAPQLLWQASGLGNGFSGVAVHDGRAFTIGDQDGKMAVVACSTKDGSLLWKANFDEPWKQAAYSGSRGTPTVDGTRVYAIGAHGALVCLDAATGKLIWEKNLAKDFGGRMMSSWGFAESPLVDGNKLLCTPGGPETGIVALDKNNGEEIWRTAVAFDENKGRDGAGYASMVISHGGGVKQYVQLTGGGLVGVAADTGKQLWSYSRIANKVANIPTPIVRGDYVFASNGYGAGTALLKLVANDDGVKAEEVYFLDGRTLQNHHGGMVLVGDHVYGGHGHNNGFPICIEFLTGKVAWNQGRGPGTGSAAVAYADGQLYFRYQNGVMALISASPEAYQLNGSFQIPKVERPSWAHPTIIDGRLYLREQDTLYCYGVQK